MRFRDSTSASLRWLISATLALAIISMSAFQTLAADDGWIGEAPPTDMDGPNEQIILQVDLEDAVADRIKDYESIFRQSLRDERLRYSIRSMSLKLPEITFSVRKHADMQRAIDTLRDIAPVADIAASGTDIRIRFSDSAIRRMERDALALTSNWLRGGNLKFRRNYFAGPDIKIYVHHSGCIRIDGISASALDDSHVYHVPFTSAELVPLYPTLDADSDHLPDGFSRLRIERMKRSPASDHGQYVMKKREDGNKTVSAEWMRTRNFIVGGQPILSGWRVVNVEANLVAGHIAVVLDLDMIAEAYVADLLPNFEGRQMGLVVDGTVIATFNHLTMSGQRLTLSGGLTDEQARMTADVLRAKSIPSNFKFAESCPPAHPSR